MHGGNKFFGFVANDATPYMIRGGVNPTFFYLSVGGNDQQNKFQLSGTYTQQIFNGTGDDWDYFEAHDGTTFDVNSTNWNKIKNLITQCQGEKVPYGDYSS